MSRRKTAATPTKPDLVVIPAPIQRMLQARQAIIDQQQHIVACLTQERDRFLAEAMGLDFVNDHWQLDDSTGTLRRLESTPPGGYGPAPETTPQEGTDA